MTSDSDHSDRLDPDEAGRPEGSRPEDRAPSSEGAGPEGRPQPSDADDAQDPPRSVPEPRDDFAAPSDPWPYTDQRLPPVHRDDDLPEVDDSWEDEYEDRTERFGDMGFFDHLEELRSRIIKSLLAFVLTSAICGYFWEFLFKDVLFGPAKRITPPLKIINTEVAGQLTLAIQVVLVSGLILAIPLIIWQLWQFVKPGLYPKERKYASGIAIATIFCFLVGITFAYFVMIPNSLGFLAGFDPGGIENLITAANYLSFVLGIILVSGVVFEMPMVSFALARFGILTPAFMRHYRRHAAVAILVISAVVTPTPDPFNCLLLAVPLYFLYELSIFVAAVAVRKRAEAMAEFENDMDPESRNEP